MTRIGTSRAVGRVLVRSVADHDWNTAPEGIDDLVRGADLHELPARAAFHGVTGCVHRSLRDNPLVDRDVADEWGRLNAGRRLPVIDGLLAATAKTHHMTLVTRNTADIADLNVSMLNPFELR